MGRIHYRHFETRSHGGRRTPFERGDFIILPKVYMNIKRISKISWFIFLSCAILPCVISIFMFFFLPDSIPAHISADGVIDRYASKAEVFIIPIANIVILILLKAFLKFIYIMSSEKSDTTQIIIHFSSIFVNLVFFALCIWYFSWLYIATAV